MIKLLKAVITSPKGNLKTQEGQPSSQDAIITVFIHSLFYELILEAYIGN